MSKVLYLWNTSHGAPIIITNVYVNVLCVNELCMYNICDTYTNNVCVGESYCTGGFKWSQIALCIWPNYWIGQPHQKWYLAQRMESLTWLLLTQTKTHILICVVVRDYCVFYEIYCTHISGTHIVTQWLRRSTPCLMTSSLWTRCVQLSILQRETGIAAASLASRAWTSLR